MRQEECLCFKQSYLLGSDPLFSLQTSNIQPCLAKLLLCQTMHSTGTSNSLGQDQQQASVPDFISWCWDITGSWWDESPRDYRCAPLLQGTVRNENIQAFVKRTEDTQIVLSQIASQGLKEFRRKIKRPLGRLNVPNTHPAQAISDTGLNLPELNFVQTWPIPSLSSQ